MNAVSSDSGGLFFVYDYGGTGKTFIWRILSTGIRSKRQIMLTIAFSEIAALLMLGGKIAHLRFVILLIINKDSTYHIDKKVH